MSRIYFRYIFFFLALLPLLTHGQNLVVNGSFESHNDCPGKIRHERLTEVNAWFQPTDGSADYYHPCGKHDSQVPRNKFGYQEAADGDAYIGMHLFTRNNQFPRYKEYLMGRLKHSMLPGAKYVVSFKVSLADESRYAIDRIGLYLSTKPVQVNTHGVIHFTVSDTFRCRKIIRSVYPNPQVSSAKNDFITNQKGWYEIRDTIEAAGEESFLIIGNFFPNSDIRPQQANREGSQLSAYYYFDDIKVEMVSPPPEGTPEPLAVKNPTPEISKEDSIKPGFTFELKNIFFEFDKSYLKPESKNALQKLYSFMNRNPGLRIEIQGHTDSVGSHRYNQQLSERRAVSVKRYLEQKGIAEERMSAKGYGKRNPLVSNRTDSGRAINRRVMIRILPKDQEGDL